MVSKKVQSDGSLAGTLSTVLRGCSRSVRVAGDMHNWSGHCATVVNPNGGHNACTTDYNPAQVQKIGNGAQCACVTRLGHRTTATGLVDRYCMYSTHAQETTQSCKRAQISDEQHGAHTTILEPCKVQLVRMGAKQHKAQLAVTGHSIFAATTVETKGMVHREHGANRGWP